MHKPKMCDCCNFRTENLEIYNSNWYCKLCTSTETSFHNRNRGDISLNTLAIMKAMCYLTNTILESNKEIKREIEDINFHNEGIKRIG